MQRPSSSSKFPLGSSLPKFTLKNVDGRTIDNNYFQGSKAALVVFTCNHCPYVKGSDNEFLEIVKRFMSRGLKVIAISSNDAEKYPEDGPEKMKEKAKALDLPYPYLYDASQEVARRFDAQCTPECYLFDEKLELVFHGALNDSPREPSRVSKHFLSEAVEAVLNSEIPALQYAPPLGCSIKWSHT
jgi:peroxiredoxin